MALLGKILLVVNLLAAVGLVYVASQDWGKRQAVNDVALRYQLVLDGLPVEPSPGDPSDSSVPLAVEVGPGIRTDYVSKKLLDAHFGSAPGGGFAGTGTPLSQVGEVKTAFEKAMQRADGADGLAYLVGKTVPPNGHNRGGLLYVLAESYEERTAIRALAERAATDAAAAKTEAVDRLKRKFDAAVNKPDPRGFDAEFKKLDDAQAQVAADPKDAAAQAEFVRLLSLGSPGFSRDDTDRRRRIAQLLMLVDVQPEQQKRAMLVCGLPVYLNALSEQTARVEEMTRRVERGFEIDQSAFEDEYELLKRLALEQDQQVLQQKRVTDGLKAQLAADTETVSKREGQLTALKDTLAQLQTNVRDLLAAQKRVEDAVFAAQTKVGQTLRDTFDKEEQLKQAEAKR